MKHKFTTIVWNNGVQHETTQPTAGIHYVNMITGERGIKISTIFVWNEAQIH
jgi:hypothetical protein